MFPVDSSHSEYLHPLRRHVTLSITWSRNSVLILLTPSCSPDLLSLRSASISSINMIEGWRCLNKLVKLKIAYGAFWSDRHDYYEVKSNWNWNEAWPLPGNSKECLDQLLSLTQPLASQAARADVDQVAARLCCQGAGKQRFSIAWKSFITKDWI